MKRKDVFEAWAPLGARWTEWAKPVLFAQLSKEEAAEATAEPADVPEAWLSGAHAIVVDAPGVTSISLGLALAAHGFRPVPLFNALPGGAESLVHLEAIQQALARGVEPLREHSLPEHAPPAFLLDSLRSTARYRVLAGRFDNRSVVFSTDFPSPERFLGSGVSRVLVLREDARGPAGDLAAILGDWMAHGIAVLIKDRSTAHPPAPYAPPRFLGLRRFWFRTIAPWFMRRSPSGEFGGVIPSGG